MVKLKLGVGLHWTEGQSYIDLVRQIIEIEELGYDQIWVSNEKFFHDMYIVSAIVAQHTNSVKIGTFVVDPYSHHPALTAMSVATLDKISGGRALLGIGAGGTGFPVMGISRNKPAVAIKEAVEIIRALWRGETVNYQGEVIKCNRGKLNINTRSDIPIVIASRGNMVLKTAGEVADSVMIATYSEPTGIRHAISMVEVGAQKAGRKMDEITFISRVDACISTDRRTAYDAVKPMIGVFLWTSYPDREFVHRVGLTVPPKIEAIIAKRDYNLIATSAHMIPDEFVDKFCWAGTAEDVACNVADVVKLGIKNITFLPHTPEGGNNMETIRQFANVVKPMVEKMNYQI